MKALYSMLFGVLFLNACMPMSVILPTPIRPPQVAVRVVCKNLEATVTGRNGPRLARVTSNEARQFELERYGHNQTFVADFYLKSQPGIRTNGVIIGSTSREFRSDLSYHSSYREDLILWKLIPDGFRIDREGNCSHY